VRFLIRGVFQQGGLCPREDECPDHRYTCRSCGFTSTEEVDGCSQCGAGWKSIDVSHGPECPKNLLDEAMNTPVGVLVRRCFRFLNAKTMGLTITLSDITEEEFQVLELIEAERGEQIKTGDDNAQSFQELLLRKLSRR
jgi:hypothetical protein